jgi:hypothetical protein
MADLLIIILIVAHLSSTARIPLFLYPFLNTVSKTRPFEYLRLTSLGVIGALVKVHSPFPRLFGVSRPI